MTEKTFKFEVEITVEDNWKDFFDTENEFFDFLKEKLLSNDVKGLSGLSFVIKKVVSSVKSVEVKENGR